MHKWPRPHNDATTMINGAKMNYLTIVSCRLNSEDDLARKNPQRRAISRYFAAIITGLAYYLLTPSASAQTSGTDSHLITLRYCNRDTNEISLAISHLENSSGPYIVRGWYKVDVNECNTLRFPKGTFYYFAQRTGTKHPMWGDGISLCVSYPGPFRYQNSTSRECSGDEEKRPFTAISVADNQQFYELTLSKANRNPVWHAIAIANGPGWVAYGYSGLKSTEYQARESALEFCREKTKKDRCKVSTRNISTDGCMFIVSGNSRRGIMWQIGPDREELRDSCKSSGYNCKEPVGGCIK